MKKYYLYLFELLFLAADFLVLILCYNVFHATLIKNICLAASVLAIIIFQLVPALKKLPRLIPAALVLLLSIPFLITGVTDLFALRNPSYVVLNNTTFFQDSYKIFNKTIGEPYYYFTGNDNSGNLYLFYIDKDDYTTYTSQIQASSSDSSAEDSEEDSSVIMSNYTSSAEFRVEYLPSSRKMMNMLSITVPVQSASKDTQNSQEEESDTSDTQTEISTHTQAEITSVIDSSTMEAKITDLGSFKSSKLKEGDTIKIQGTMTLLYPFNIQEFYEIKEGDTVDFMVNSIEDGEPPVLITSFLNLVTE